MGKFVTGILLYLCTIIFTNADNRAHAEPGGETKTKLATGALAAETPKESNIPSQDVSIGDEEKKLPRQSLSTDALGKEIETRKTMLDWSRHLGVTCNYCHDTNNFKNDDKLAYRVGLKHKNLVRLLNEEVFTERDKGGALKIVADCYMCHRGLSTPKYMEPPQNLMK